MSLNIDVHVIQSVPPSNINRDETGSPKTAIYGGVRRARVSSQAWKRATRRDFGGYLDESAFGVRTKRAVELLAKRISELNPSLAEQSQERALEVLNSAELKAKQGRKSADGDAPLTEYLMFFSNVQLEKLAVLAASAEGPISKKEAKAILKSDNSYDLALFGRMVANDADLNVDAACQVAHALSTHAVSNEFDYFTAVDDKNPDEETGAGMIGTVEFNSATLYRYATVNIDALGHNLGNGEATRRATEAFVRSFVMSMPTGKQNTFANGTMPEAVVVMVRNDRPVSFVGAFESPVRAGQGGFVEDSAKHLASYAKDIAEAFGTAPEKAWVTRVGEKTAPVDALGERVSFESLITQLGERVLAAFPEQQ